ncbi:septum formation family protein [Herbiconiux sp. KACC 21604]|uniref:DUF4190 domain-containing protein n=1 Tax=unclassified Herbiconiux TaxID=2618217 RepID=UPI001491FA5E|nr:DUF4190 domain-containing protein [Herbiconiux sp. SALV-R1]QJU54871.1 hypothetical protein HL652_15450 [Herbiconiux sp. SALV-R1]WPO85993.1 septum formation family protein [Herbiconiux sp. KACC 21604]
MSEYNPAARPPAAGRPEDPDKTLGFVGLGASLVVNVAGIVISAIALQQSRRAGYRNSAALAGLIVGGSTLVLGLLVGIVVTVPAFTISFGVLAMAAGSAVASGGSWSSSGPSGPSTGENPGPGQGGETPGEPGGAPFAYGVGDCFLEPEPGDGAVDVVDCDEAHDYEVYDEFEVPDTADGAYPGDDRMGYAADEGCLDRFEDFTGIAWDDSLYDFTYAAPNETTWTDYDDRLVLCAVFDPEGPTRGSLEDVGE